MLWIKSFHLISVICWFAGIFYLPRLFVYHAMAVSNDTRAHLKLMERKLYRFMSLFGTTTVLFGGWLVSFNWQYYWQSGWFLVKLLLVALLITYHFCCGYFVRQLARDQCQRTHVFFRWFNEMPVVVLFAVVILVIVKPF